MVKLRSQRYGSKKKPFYRIVATDSRNPRDGRHIEVIGTYNPLTNPVTVKFDEEKVKCWCKTYWYCQITFITRRANC